VEQEGNRNEFHL